jgi:hypothetical protein
MVSILYCRPTSTFTMFYSSSRGVQRSWVCRSDGTFFKSAIRLNRSQQMWDRRHSAQTALPARLSMGFPSNSTRVLETFHSRSLSAIRSIQDNHSRSTGRHKPPLFRNHILCCWYRSRLDCLSSPDASLAMQGSGSFASPGSTDLHHVAVVQSRSLRTETIRSRSLRAASTLPASEPPSERLIRARHPVCRPTKL